VKQQQTFRSIRDDERKLQKLAETFRILGDGTRIRIISLLAEAEHSVSDIAQLLELSESLVSHQLRVLRNTNLVKYRREGKNIFYELDDDHIGRLLREGLRHIEEPEN